MQNVSQAYKDSMTQPLRNRGYIKVSIGVINSEAQKKVNVNNENNDFTYYSNKTKLFNGYPVDRVYATFERDFTKVDGSMYYLPDEDSGLEYYNNGLVSNTFGGTFYVNFDTEYGLDIKGLRINWGEYYPIDFTIENDDGVHTYNGNKDSVWTTEDVFNNTTYLIIRVNKMQNKALRARIYGFECGIVNVFTGNNVISYSHKDYVSPISETVPSQDTTIIVSNYDLYYSPDNPDSALTYMEVGQEIRVAFGYDVVGNGKEEDIEWLPEFMTYLKTWSADDSQAKFTGTDRFDYLTDKYYKGHYYADGISLYDLAIDVLTDAGITDSREYFLDPYLKKVIINNPMPVVTHAEALQIIANAGRCALSADRQRRIHMQSSFIPDMSITSNGETEYSLVENVLNDEEKIAYAVFSNDFTTVDETVLYIPDNEEDYLPNRGYVSSYISDENGLFVTNPKLTIELEASFIAHGLNINFRNVAPKEFVIRTYNQDELVETYTFKNTELNFTTHNQFNSFTKMEIEITKGYPKSAVFIDNILVDNVTDYILGRQIELKKSPTSTRQNKIKSINIERTLYNNSQNTESSSLKSEELTLNVGNTEYTVYFTKASYNYSVSVTDKDGTETTVSCEIIESNNFYVTLRFLNVTDDNTVVKYEIQGYEYEVGYNWLIVPHNDTGEVKEWRNPLISTVEHGKDVEDWLASYFLGDVVYQINWRGDPRIDANDLFYLETKDKGKQLIRGYENDLQFKGSWSSTIKARRAVLEWQ